MKKFRTFVSSKKEPVMKKHFLFSLILFSVFTGGFSQNLPLKPQVDKPVYFDVSPPLRDLVLRTPSRVDHSWKDGVVPNKFAPSDNQTSQEGQQPFVDPSVQEAFGYLQTDTTLQNFNGVGATGGV